ncbi:MAG: hypothetical protein GQ525_05260 [Draconibacterium sp.]|nr:hypothetical protein [Draconibacterium sp.]
MEKYNKIQRLSVYIMFSIILLIANSCNERNNETRANFNFDEDGMLVINGKRKFIIGSYYLPKTETPFNTLAANGYNYVRTKDAAGMDAAHKNNLYAWIYTKSITKEKKEEDIKRITNMVNELKNHPALLFWEMEDEPSFKWNSAASRISPEQMKETYDFIKQLDPEHLIITNHGPVNLISTLQKYNASTDLVACDVYPVVPYGIKPSYALYPDGLQCDLLNPYISQVGEYVAKMKKVVHNSKPVFMVLQGFSWEILKKESERDTSMILYPTYEESRFMAYNAIISGANGIIYWGTNYAPQPSPFINDLNKVTKELAEMQNVLAAPTVKLNIKKEYHELMYSVDTGVEILVKEVDGKTYLLAVNSDKNPVKVTLDGLIKFGGASVLKENRNLKVENGKLTDTFNPFDVHVYKLNK